MTALNEAPEIPRAVEDAILDLISAVCDRENGPLSRAVIAQSEVEYARDALAQLFAKASAPDAVAVERATMRKFIERISEHNCGCTPVCHCDDNIPALQAWKYAVRDEALEILARSQP